MIKKNPRLILCGGGTGGSVSPLLAIAEEANREGFSCDFLFVGSSNGPEKRMATDAGIEFVSIPAGKFRRYFSVKNFTDVYHIISAFFRSIVIIRSWKPDLVLTAGSFVCVPLALACRVTGVPYVVHQQDVRPGLANILMAPFASLVTVVFEKSLADFPQALHLGNPARLMTLDNSDKSALRTFFDIQSSKPVVLVVGGGTGSLAVNNILAKHLPILLSFCEIIHVSGGKPASDSATGYHPFNFLDKNDLAKAYAVADIIITRAGLGFLTEISSLAKPSIIIPLPETHQVDNARLYSESSAAVHLSEDAAMLPDFPATISNLLTDEARLVAIGQSARKLIVPDASTRYLQEVKKIILKK
jgi:UDP-N-acetylglucosamine--N-acetylmuramyl-(pentapeptide) pyrophosphoryl-undecaprenol N-acetylglucosamine transferase